MNQTEAPLSDRFIAGVSYGGLSMIGLVFNMILLIILLKNRTDFSSGVFYSLAWELMLGDIGILIAEVIVAMPLSLSGKALFGEGVIRLLLSSIDTVSFCVILLTAFFLSLNRFATFIAPKLNEILFTKPIVYIIFAIPWIFGLFWALYTTLIGCPKTFFHEAYYFSYNCSSEVTKESLYIYDFIQSVCSFIPIISLIFYMTIFVKLRLISGMITADQTLMAQQRKRERSFLTQALVICCSLELECLVFTYSPKLAIAGLIDWYWITLFIGWSIILNSSINPIIYFVFNQSIREAFMNLIRQSQVVQVAREADPARTRSSQPVIVHIPSDVQR